MLTVVLDFDSAFLTSRMFLLIKTSLTHVKTIVISGRGEPFAFMLQHIQSIKNLLFLHRLQKGSMPTYISMQIASLLSMKKKRDFQKERGKKNPQKNSILTISSLTSSLAILTRIRFTLTSFSVRQ